MSKCATNHILYIKLNSMHNIPRSTDKQKYRTNVTEFTRTSNYRMHLHFIISKLNVGICKID